MKKQILLGVHLVIIMTVFALPVQAAVNIGAPRSSSGSVVTLHTTGSVTTVVTPTQTSTPSSQGTPVVVSTPPATSNNPAVPTNVIHIGAVQPASGGNVISLKNLTNQSQSIPVTVNPTTTPTTPTSTPTTPTTPTLPVIPQVTQLTADEQHMVDMINQERVAAGVNPVTVDLRLASVGRAKANDLKANNYFDHTSPTYGSPWAMMQQVGLTVKWAGENISGNKSVEGSMAALMLSPGHRANILDPRFTHVGVGIAYGSAYGNLYVQEFLQE